MNERWNVPSMECIIRIQRETFCNTFTNIQSYRHQICDFEMRVNEMLAIVVLYYKAFVVLIRYQTSCGGEYDLVAYFKHFITVIFV